MSTDDDTSINSNHEYMEAYISQAVSMDHLPILIFIAAIMGLGKGGVPGFATIATALTVTTAPVSITGGLGYAVALQVPILTMIDISAAWLHSDSLDWPTVWFLLPLSFVGMGFGMFLDQYMNDSSARILVGCILLSILTLRLRNDFVNIVCPKPQKRSKSFDYNDDEDIEIPLNESQNPPETSLPASTYIDNPLARYGWAAVVGLLGGAATMLTNSMGPILNVYLLSVRKLSPTAYIGTRAIFFCFLNLGKLPMRFLSGTLGWIMIPLAAGLGLVSVLGVFCAKPIMLSMSERTFVRLELLVVAFAGFRLLWMGIYS